MNLVELRGLSSSDQEKCEKSERAASLGKSCWGEMRLHARPERRYAPERIPEYRKA